jgi:hypothetical protein
MSRVSRQVPYQQADGVLTLTVIGSLLSATAIVLTTLTFGI